MSTSDIRPRKLRTAGEIEDAGAARAEVLMRQTAAAAAAAERAVPILVKALLEREHALDPAWTGGRTGNSANLQRTQERPAAVTGRSCG